MPFSITPDPAYIYMSQRHQEALGHLLYGTGQYGGFVQLTGEVGTGKTTIVRTLLEQKMADVDVAIIHNPRQSELEFVQSICDELGVTYPKRNCTLKTLVDALNEHLLQAHREGRRTVLIIDEAQNLQPEVLEQVRLLTNLETAKEKLLRIMLIGQPELSALLARPDLRQLASRITARYHLMPLGAQETREYIEHRLRVAGSRSIVFNPAASKLIHHHSRGVPRLINIICDRALLGAYADRSPVVTPYIVRKAAREVTGELPHVFDPSAKVRWRFIEWGWGLALAVSAGLFIYTFFWSDEPAQAVAAADPSPTPVSTPEPAPDMTPAPEPAAPAIADTALPTHTALPQSLPVSSVNDLPQAVQPLSVVLARLTQLWSAGPIRALGPNLCTALAEQGLECYRSYGDWDDLRQMDRPAVLSLKIAGTVQYFLLESLGATYAILDTALGPMRLPIASLTPLWTGEFLALWRRETHDIRIDRLSDGPDVRWLWQRLRDLGYISAAQHPSDVFDDALDEAVRQFQTEQGLSADGIAGVRTLIELGDDQPDTPKLISRLQ